MTQQQASLGQLTAELIGLDRRIEVAAVEGDAGEFVALSMRRAAIPALIREVRAAPVKAELERLEEESAAMDAEVERVRSAPYADVPPGLRGRITPLMAHDARLREAIGRVSEVGGEIKKLRRVLEQIETEGPKPPT